MPRARARTAAAILVVGCVVGDASAPADAANPTQTERCLAANEKGQLARKDARYRSARESFRVCAGSACPAAVSRDCAQWLHELDMAQPTVVLSARDPLGRDTSDIAVTVDGEPLSGRLDGRAIDVDPGERLFRFEAPDGSRMERREIVREGEKGRLVIADFRTLPGAQPSSASAPTPRLQPTTAPSGDRRIPTGSWVLGALGVAGIGAGSVLLITGRVHEADKAGADCARQATCEGVDAIRREYWAGGVALGIGVAALGAAILIAATAR